ncbi:glycosyltransferase [Patescibacteria group bacterium]|nr:glycosyltransferase [Patescibacteria group bacterium]MBU4309151.1 glycosyltransferase [Patescibacteria group bacterium]MBU4577512.1 glycosyltransferase [Patescibacteria group bacterium]
MITNKKIALVHDHLAQDGGAEKVLKVLADMFPEAPIYTLLYEEKHVNKYFKGREIKTSIIQKLPGGVKHYQWYLKYMPIAVEFFDLSDFDIVISDASAFAKGVITKPDTLHICYCHTPTRYLWDYTHQYINELSYNKYFKKVISLVLNKLRIWDFVAAQRVDLFIANSQTVQKRISKYYRRDSEIIYPPVELSRFKISNESKDYFLIGGRLAAYKRVDIVVEAFKKLKDKKLKIFGSGVDIERLKSIANGADNIEFLGRVSEDEKAELYSNCLAFINPQEEDFGITVVEAMASGRPVIAYKKGGATETVISGKTGLFFDNQSVESLVEAINVFDKHEFNSSEIKKHAESFSEQIFKDKINIFISQNSQGEID